MAIDIVCVCVCVCVCFPSPKVRYSRVCPVLSISNIRAGSNSSTRPNISGHQLRRLYRALSHTTRITR
jgi:hypothetical protein